MACQGGSGRQSLRKAVVTQLTTVNGEVEQGVKDYTCQKRRRDAEGHSVRHHHRSGDLALS